VPGEAGRLATGCRHHKYIKIAIPIAGKCNGLAIAAPYGHHIMRLVDGERRGYAAGRIYFVQIAFVAKHNGAAIGADGGVTKPQGFILTKGRAAQQSQQGAYKQLSHIPHYSIKSDQRWKIYIRDVKFGKYFGVCQHIFFLGK
jgi:hypothetical protein